MSSQRSFLSVAYDAEEDFHSLLETLSVKPVELRVGKRDIESGLSPDSIGELKLWITPRPELTEDEQERIVKFRDRIIRMIQDDEYKRDRELNGEDAEMRRQQHVFDLAREYFSEKEETG